MPRKSAPRIERVPSGIPGLDRLIQGGFVKGTCNLISGTAGTGKTIFASQYIWHGLQNGEKCLFLSFEENPDEIREAALDFGWDFKPYEKKGKLVLRYEEPSKIQMDPFYFREELKEKGYQRIAVDSTSVMGFATDNLADVRKNLMTLISELKRYGATSIITGEMEEGSEKISRFGVEEFLVDGVIVLYFTGIGGEEGNNLQVRKMRRTKHAKGYFPLIFTKNGLKVGREGISVLMK